jgi:ferric-dicitrate binding protein FerR (iron transport regulator)
MTFRSEHGDLSPAERRAYQSVERDTPIDPAEEERTVQFLRARGVFGGRNARMNVPQPSAHAVARRRAWRATAIAGIAAAAVLAVLLQRPASRRTAAVVAHVASSTLHTMQPAESTAAAPQRKSSLLVWY